MSSSRRTTSVSIPRPGWSPFRPAPSGEIHLAGHGEDTREGLLIDNHGAPVCDEVWELYADFINRIGPRSTLIEWDTQVPALEVLLGQTTRAQALLHSTRAQQLTRSGMEGDR